MKSVKARKSTHREGEEVPSALRRWEIQIDGWRPASLNELLKGGPWGAHRLKKRDRQHVALFGRMARVPLAMGKRRVTLRITLPKSQRRWDIDAFQKSTLDALAHVESGFLVDDRDKWAEWGGVEYERGIRLSTTIVLEDIA